MEHLRWLLGTLQQAADFVSSFTTYLLGDEAHPGAEESGSTKEKRNSRRRSRHDSEAPTHHGDISPRGHPEVFEGQLSAEMALPNQEIRMRSEAAVSGVQVTEAAVEASSLSYKWEGQEESRQKLSESSQLLAGSPKPRPTAAVTGSLRQRDPQEPTMAGGLHQRGPEGTSWMGAVHKGVLEEAAATEWRLYWEPDRPLAGSEEHGELDGAGEPKGGQEREQKGTVWDEGVQQGPPDLAWTGGSQPGELEGPAKMAEGPQPEAEMEQEGEAEAAEDQQGEPDMAAAQGGIQQVMPGGAEIVEDQEGAPDGGGEKFGGRSHPEWEPKGEREEAGGTEGRPERELLEEALWDEGLQQAAPDQAQLVGGLQQRLEGAGWTGGCQQHVGLEGQQSEAEKEQEGEAEAEEEGQKEEPNMAAGEEGILQAMLERAEIEGDEEEGMLGEEETDRGNREWEPKGGREREEARRNGGSQERGRQETLWNEGATAQILFVGGEQRDLEGAARTGGFQHGGLLEAEAKMAEGQQLGAEKEQEGEAEAEQDQQGEPDMAAAQGGILQAMLGRAETVEDQEGAPEGGGEKVGGRSREWEPKGEREEAAAGGTEGRLERELEEALRDEEVQQGAPGRAQPDAEAEEDQQWEADMAAAKGGIQPAMLGGAETVEDQEGAPEGEEEQQQAEGSRQWEPKETVTSAEQDGEPKGVAENGKGQQGEQAGAEVGQQGELEEPVRNGAEAKGEEPGEEEWLESDQEEAPGRPAEASGLDEGVLEEAETTGDQSRRQPEETDGCLQQEPMEYSASVSSGPLAGPRTFLAELTPLDTSAQKERVLLRRKSSIRRAPSLKKARPTLEIEPQQTIVAEDTPSQPQAPSRPKLRHSGFGPMHPNMMAELQMRLRKPQ